MDGYMGEIRLFAAGYAPQNWLLCQGQILQTSQYSALFAVIGSVYGGDGRQTFAVPNLSSRVAVGAGQGPGLQNVSLGQAYGAEQLALSVNNLASHKHALEAHTHDMYASAAAAQTEYPSGKVNATVEEGGYGEGAMLVQMSSSSIGQSANSTTTDTGGTDRLRVIQPSTGMNYIICVVGTFPPRP